MSLQKSKEDKNYDSKEWFYWELEQVFDHLPKYHVKVLLEDFIEKFESDDLSKLRIGNGILL